MATKGLHRRILELRTYVAVALVVAATAHHLAMRMVPIEFHLVSEIFVYGFVVPVAAWGLLGWVARSVAAAETANHELTETAAMLSRRNRQVEAIYTTSRLLAGAHDVRSVAGPLVELAGKIAHADKAALMLYPQGDDAPRVSLWAKDGLAPDDLDLETFSDASLSPCLTCTASPNCDLKDGLRCFPLVDGQELFGILRIFNPIWSSGTESSLNAFVSEITASWQSRRAEERAIRTFQRLGQRSLAAIGERADSRPVLDLLAEALGAEAAQFFLSNGDEIKNSGSVESDAAVLAPRATPYGTQSAIWVENGGRLVYARSDNGRIVGLSFPGARKMSVREKQLIGVAAALAEFDRQATERSAELVWEERRRISGELHDGIAQTVAYLNLRMHRGLDLWREGRLDEAEGNFAAISLALLDAYEEIRMAVDDLRLYPGDGEQAGSFLRRMAAAFASREGVQILVDMRSDLHVPPEILAQVTRVFQEALHNAVVHGKASRIDLGVVGRGRTLEFTIADNGIGFDPKRISVHSHYGLAVMRERVEELGGSFQLESQVGSGTSISVTLPLPRTIPGLAIHDSNMVSPT